MHIFFKSFACFPSVRICGVFKKPFAALYLRMERHKVWLSLMKRRGEIIEQKRKVYFSIAYRRFQYAHLNKRLLHAMMPKRNTATRYLA